MRFLRLFQVLIQARKFLFPELPEGLHPAVGIPERSRDKRARTPLCIPSTPHQTGTLKHGEVFRDCRLTEFEWLHELRYVRFSHRQPCEDCAAGRVRQCSKGETERIARVFNLPVAIFPSGDIKVKGTAAFVQSELVIDFLR